MTIVAISCTIIGLILFTIPVWVRLLARQEAIRLDKMNRLPLMPSDFDGDLLHGITLFGKPALRFINCRFSWKKPFANYYGRLLEAECAALRKKKHQDIPRLATMYGSTRHEIPKPEIKPPMPRCIQYRQTKYPVHDKSHKHRKKENARRKQKR